MRFYTGSYTRMGGPGVGVCSWENGQLTGYELTSPIDQTLRVVSGGKETAVELKAGQTVCL